MIVTFVCIYARTYTYAQVDMHLRLVHWFMDRQWIGTQVSRDSWLEGFTSACLSMHIDPIQR